MRALVFLVGFSLLTLGSFAQRKNFGVDTTRALPQGLSVGDVAPAFITTSIDGAEIDTEKILAKKKIVLLFYRGQWCSVCDRYLSRYQDSVAYIFDKDAIVIAVGPELAENAAKSAKRHKANILVVADPSMAIQNSYDVLFYVTEKYQQMIHNYKFTDIDKNNGQDEAQLPVPATYIIGKDGKIEYVHFDYNYKKRASVKEILDHL